METPLRILMLEDNKTDAELTQLELKRAGLACDVKRVESEKAFVHELIAYAPNLVLSDYSLPSYDGLSALAYSHKYSPHVPFIFVSGTIGEDLAIEALKNGATDYVFKQRLSRLAPAVHRAIKETNERLQRERAEEKVRRLNADLERSHAELLLTYDATLEGWSRALDLRDHGTEGHSLRVTAITVRLAKGLGIGEADLVHIRRGALLHDIGKMGVPDRILLKDGPLTPEEWEIMKQHPVYAYEMLKPM